MPPPQPPPASPPLPPTAPASAGQSTLPTPDKPLLSESRLTLLLCALLLLSFFLQVPTHRVADWQQFSFYDPGTVLKGDLLLSKDYIPTVDFGYTHGLASLLYARFGFETFGRAPWAFFALTLLTEIGMAWAIARILRATGIAKNWWSLGFVWVALPMAIMPAYLTLTHPLEAMLILLALAAQAEGSKPLALGIATVCLFVKPSMAYVYGLVLVLMIFWESRSRPLAIFWKLVPAAIAGLILALALAERFGFGPVFQTLLPTTGAKTYATTGFGFFTPTGREFWVPADRSQYLFSPAGVFLLAAAACAVGGLIGAFKFFRVTATVQQEGFNRRRVWELLLTIGAMHTAFLLSFYGWTGSWTYYSYLPVLGLALFTALLFKRPLLRGGAFGVLSLLMLLSYSQLLSTVWGAWKDKTARVAAGPGAAPGLWRHMSLYDQWTQVLSVVGDRPTLVLTNGYLFDLPATIEMPDAWFPEPGIPTVKEIARVKAQMARAEFVILWNEYGPSREHPDLQLWSFPDFTADRAVFQPVQETDGGAFTILRRSAATSSAPATIEAK